ncbi:MAG: SRPBCC family protein [bacterium]
MKTRDIKQVLRFQAPIKEIYEMLMDEKKHSELTGSKAIISEKVDGEFSLYDGSITGKNLQLVKNKKIVQEWRYDFPDWPEDYFSIVTFTFKDDNGNTKLYFSHEDIPAQFVDDIEDGWHQYYWKPMKKILKI